MTTGESGSDAATYALRGADAVTQASSKAREYGEMQWLTPEELARLSVIIEELVANLYEHGGVAPDHEIELTLASEPGAIRITLVDTGTPFDPRSARIRAKPYERGGNAGLDIVHAWALIVAYETTKKGNRLELLLPVGT